MDAEKDYTTAELRALLEKALAGDPEATKFMIARGRERFTLAGFKGAGMAHMVRASIANTAVGEGHDYVKFRMIRESELFAESLQGPNPSPLEVALAEQVSVTWMALREAEATLAASGEISFKDAYWRQSKVDSAHARFLSAVRTLAQVRRLQLPTLVQLNVANQQVNVAGQHASVG